MRVNVVPVVVPVRMDVLLRAVRVDVGVAARQQQRDRDGEQQSAGDVGGAECLAEPEPGQTRAEEGRTREARLRARGAEALRGGDVERDAHAVAERAHRECRRQQRRRRRVRLERAGERQIEAAGGETLPEGAARRCQSVDQRGPVVVERPAEACGGHQRGRQEARPAAAPRDDGAGRHHARRAEPAAAREVLAEERDAQHRRRGELEVQQERDGAGVREAQRGEQQQRSGDAARGDRAGEAPPVAGVEPRLRARARARLARKLRRHRQRRAEVQEPGEREGAELRQQRLAERRRRSEEHCRDERGGDALHRAPGVRWRARAPRIRPCPHGPKATSRPLATTDRFLRFYDPVFRLLLREDALRREIVARAALAARARVLDVGCGTGTQLLWLGRSHPDAELIGIDGDAKVLAIARGKLARAGVRAQLDEGLATALPYPDARFDRVLSSLVVHHLIDDDKRRALAEIRRVLAPDGVFLLADFGPPQSWLERASARVLTHFEHARTNLQQGLAALLVEAGFARVDEQPLRSLGLGRIYSWRASAR